MLTDTTPRMSATEHFKVKRDALRRKALHALHSARLARGVADDSDSDYASQFMERNVNRAMRLQRLAQQADDLHTSALLGDAFC